MRAQLADLALRVKTLSPSEATLALYECSLLLAALQEHTSSGASRVRDRQPKSKRLVLAADAATTNASVEHKCAGTFWRTDEMYTRYCTLATGSDSLLQTDRQGRKRPVKYRKAFFVKPSECGSGANANAVCTIDQHQVCVKCYEKYKSDVANGLLPTPTIKNL